MRFSFALLLLWNAGASRGAAFCPVVVPQAKSTTGSGPTATTRATGQQGPLFGYLDDLSKDLYAPTDDPDVDGSAKEVTDLKKENVDRAGPGDWSSYVEFNEFDGGDGQMGVAGDGKQGLEKFGDDVSPSLAKSKTMSAKNAWGTSTGYADELMSKGVERQRAQQMENWMNQQEILKRKNQHRAMTETFDQVSADEDWRSLGKFGVERNQEFDLDAEFGAVVADSNIEGVIELHSRMGQNAVHEFSLKNEYMGFADFRARFTDDTNPAEWSIQPSEGSLSSRDYTNFILRFRPNRPGMVEGYLVVETEDFKKTWKLVGSTA